MPACNQQCNNSYCVSDQQAQDAMAKHPELSERYANESQHIRDAIKTLVHADGGLTRLHWLEVLLLMKKFGNDIALMHHTNFRNLAAPVEELAETLRSYDQAIWCLEEVMWGPDASPVNEYREWMVQTPPHIAHFIGSQQSTPHHPMHNQNVRPLLPALQIPTPASQTGIIASQWELPPRRTRRSSSKVQASDSWLPCASPSMAGASTPVGVQLALGMMAPPSQSLMIPTGAAANPSASETRGRASPKRRRESDACSECKFRKTGCGGRFKHCLKKAASNKCTTATPIEKAPRHAQHKRRVATFPNHTITQPASNGGLPKGLPRSQQLVHAAEDSCVTGSEGDIPFEWSVPPPSGAALGLRHAHSLSSEALCSLPNSLNRQVFFNDGAENGVNMIFSELGNGQDNGFDPLHWHVGFDNEQLVDLDKVFERED